MLDTDLTFPKISVIVPIYNVAGHVAACIDSLRAQSQQSFEVIAVDDGSTDGSAEIARMAADGDPRFRFVHQDNGGLSAARNTGLDMARAEFICFVDSDDRVAPEFLNRLLTTLQDTGADWVACGVMMCHPDGREIPHTATHSATPDGAVPKEQAENQTGKPGAAIRHDFTDWQEIVRHFPSAWNKMYRRSLIGSIRFDEGLYYEDHPFFYRCCARTDHLVLLPDPLYLHTQGRDGQITRDGSDRVFEQFTVLEVMRDLMQEPGAAKPETGSETKPKAGPKTGADAAFAQIATRLTFERSQAINNRVSRAAFLAQARKIAGTAPSDRLGVPAYWMSLLRGRLPVSVVIPSDGNVSALTQTLDSLAHQSLKEAEILVVLDDTAARQRAAVFSAVAGFDGVSVLTGSGDPGVAGARNRGLDAARGQTLVFLDAGDTLPPEALNIWYSRLHQTGAECGFARFITGDGNGGGPHSGLHDRTALPDGFDAPGGFAPQPRDAVFIHAHPSAKIFDRAFLNQHRIRFAPEPLSSWAMLLAVMARASRAVYLQHPPARIADRPDTRQLWRAPVALDDLVGALEHMRQRAIADADADIQADLDTGALDAADYMRLFVRAVWEKVNFADFPDDDARQAFQTAARQHCKTQARPNAPLDPYVGARLRNILGLPPAAG